MESIEALQASEEVWMESEEEKEESSMEMGLPVSRRAEEELPGSIEVFNNRLNWWFIAWVFTLTAASIAAICLVLAKGFSEASQELSLDFERAWWSMFSLFGVLPFVVGLYGLRVLQPSHVKVVLYTIDPVVPQGWETPRKILELERKRLFWPNGEFKALPLTELQLGLPFRITQRISSSTGVYKVNMSLPKWKALRDRISFQLQCMSREAFLSGVAIKHSFLWVLLASGSGRTPMLALMREPLLDAINHLEMDWRKLLDEDGVFAGCKSAARREDGEWIGSCRGSTCQNQEHKETEAIYRLFRIFSRLDVHTGRIPNVAPSSSNNGRMLLGFVDLHIPAALNLQKTTQKAVWKLHKWDHL